MKIWPLPYFVAPIEEDDKEIQICNPEDGIAVLDIHPPCAGVDAARPFDIGTAEYLVQAANQKEDSDFLASSVLEFIALLEVRELSENNHEFSPNTISSCRCMDADRIGRLLPEMKLLAQRIQSDIHTSAKICEMMDKRDEL